MRPPGTDGERISPRSTEKLDRRGRLVLCCLLLLALGLRLGGLFHDLPFSYYGDELHMMKRAMALGAGDLNPHWFHKPAFLMYVLLFCYGLYFLGGSLVGRFESADQFAGHFLSDNGPFLLIGRLVVVLCGVVLVWVVFQIGRRLSNERQVPICAALLVAVTPALVASSQIIKADMPCALFIALSLLCYIRDLDRGRTWSWWLVSAALLAGVAMGTKYYGIVLIPAYLLWETGRAMRGALGWGAMVARQAVIAMLFVLGFFVVSPYNFLDPTWSVEVERKIAIALDAEAPVFEIDASKEFLPGPAAWIGAGLDFLRRLVDHSGLGLPLVALFVLGLIASLSRRRVHGLWTLLALPCVIFVAISVVFAPYHAQARHLAAIMPLLCLFTWPAAKAVTSIFVLSKQRRGRAAMALVVVVASVNLVRSVLADVAIMKKDSRTLAYEWVIENLSREDRLLLDDDGPSLQPNDLAIARMRQRLADLDPGPFVIHEDQRLDILETYESPEARNIDLLSRQWWLNQEKTDRQLARSLIDSDMGNPLVSRVPKPLAEYKEEGIRYVLTTSIGSRWLLLHEDPDVQFPSFVRFYRELAELEPVVTFDPEAWNGKGPIIWIHDLSRLDPARPVAGHATGSARASRSGASRNAEERTDNLATGEPRGEVARGRRPEEGGDTAT